MIVSIPMPSRSGPRLEISMKPSGRRKGTNRKKKKKKNTSSKEIMLLEQVPSNLPQHVVRHDKPSSVHIRASSMYIISHDVRSSSTVPLGVEMIRCVCSSSLVRPLERTLVELVGGVHPRPIDSSCE